MATIKELQEAINNNSLDPSKLSKEQYNAVEQLIEEGKIESKPLGQIQEERDDAALKIARVRQIEEDPIRAKRIAEGKTGSRATFEL